MLPPLPFLRLPASGRHYPCVISRAGCGPGLLLPLPARPAVPAVPAAAGPAGQGPVLPGIVWYFIKTFFFLGFFILLRAGLPRPRFDQLMGWGWKLMLPLALANLLVTGAVKLALFS